jgi:cell division protein FtsN
MKRIFFIVLSISMILGACKHSKTIQSGYQPPVVNSEDSASTAEDDARNTAIKAKPIFMRTEGITFYNPNDANQGYYDYYVIIGSFSNASNATNLSDQLIVQGFDPIILRSDTGNLRVAVKGTNDKQEANELVYRIRSISPEHGDVWLLKRK